MEMEDIIDIKDTIAIEPGIQWSLWIGIGLLSLIIIALLLLIIKKSMKTKAVQPPTPQQVANKKLEKLSLTLETSDDEIYADELSEVLREFIETRYKLPSSKSTTQEFLQLLSNKSPFDQEIASALQKFLELCDQVKFAKHSLSSSVKKELLDIATVTAELERLRALVEPHTGGYDAVDEFPYRATHNQVIDFVRDRTAQARRELGGS